VDDPLLMAPLVASALFGLAEQCRIPTPRSASLSSRFDLLSGDCDLEHRGTTTPILEGPVERTPNLLAAVGAFQAGDPVSALDQTLAVLETEPDHDGAQAFLDRITPPAERALTARLGPLDVAPRPTVELEDLHTLPLDREEALVLSRADGESTFEELCHLGEGSPVETLRLLVGLVEAGLLER